MARRRRTTFGPGGVGIQQPVGSDTTASVGVTPSGNFRAGVSKPIGGANVGLGVDSSGTIGAQASWGTDDVQVNASAGINPFTMTPSGGLGVTFGNSPESRRGGQIGRAIMPFMGGDTIGSLVGNQFKASEATKQGRSRDSVLNAFKDSGLFEDGYKFTLPDGTVADFDKTRDSTERPWYNERRRNDKSGNRGLYAYEADYTNDLDFISSMGGTTLSRMLAGGANKAVDQVGQLIGNQALGSVGHGAELNQKNFNTVMKNQRALFARKDIQTKEDLQGLVNTALAQGRINDTEASAMAQVGRMVFDNDYNLATSLSQNRWSGINTAAKTPSGQSPIMGGNQRRLKSPYISVEEAVRSTQPLIDMYKSSMKEGFDMMYNKTKGNIANITQGIALATGAYKIGNELSGGELGNLIKGGASYIKGGLSDLWDSMNNNGYEDPYQLDSNLDLSASSSDVNPVVDDGMTFDTNLDLTSVLE